MSARPSPSSPTSPSRSAVRAYREFRKTQDDLEGAQALLKDGDPEMREMAEEEVAQAKEALLGLESALAMASRGLPIAPPDDARLAPFRADGTLPDYPLGSDFTPVEQRLAKALLWLKANTATRGAKLATIAKALLADGAANDAEREALARMGYDAPASFADKMSAKLVLLGLRRSG